MLLVGAPPAVMDTPRSSPSQDPCPEEDEDWLHLSSSSLDPQPPPCSSGSSSHEEQEEQRGRLRTRLVSTLNNVKYGQYF